MKWFHFGILVLMLFGWALFAVDQQTRLIRHGYAIRHLEEERVALSDENRELQRRLAVLARPERVAVEVQRLGLPLVPPAEANDFEAQARAPAP